MSREEAVAKAVKSGAQNGTLAAAASIVSGIAIQEIPIKILWIFTVGTSTVINWPLALGLGAIAGLASGVASYLKHCAAEEEVDRRLLERLQGGGRA